MKNHEIDITIVIKAKVKGWSPKQVEGGLKSLQERFTHKMELAEDTSDITVEYSYSEVKPLKLSRGGIPLP